MSSHFHIMINKMVIGYMADQMSGAAMAMPQDPKAAFKAEWKSLEIVQHQWALRNVEAELLGTTSHSKTD